MPMQGPMIPPPAAVLATAATARTRESLEIGGGDDDVQAEPSTEERLKTSAIHLALAVGTVVSIGAVLVSPAGAVFVMAGILVANVPYSAYKEHQLGKLPALRQLNNYLREDANKLESAVDALGKEIDELRPEADRAADVEGELKKIAAEQDRTTDNLVDLVKENGRIVKEMEDNLRQRIVQDMLRIVVSSDRNNDGTFSENETAMLALKIGMQLQEDDVDFDQEKFKKVMRKAPTMAQTIKIVRRLVPALPEEGEGPGDAGADPDEEDDFDMFHRKGDAAAAGDAGAAARPRPSLGLAQQPAARLTSRREKFERLTPSLIATAHRYRID